MRIFREPFPAIKEKVSAVALGTFDGVHLGHRAVIEKAVRLAEAEGGDAAVWCFSRPPRFFFSESADFLLSAPEEKAAAIESLGVSLLVMPDPDASLFSVNAEEFLKRLVASLSPAHIVCGFNYRFGKGALGTPELMNSLLEPMGIGVTVVPAVTEDGGIPVSSTMIRQRMKEGKDISDLLGK